MRHAVLWTMACLVALIGFRAWPTHAAEPADPADAPHWISYVATPRVVDPRQGVSSLRGTLLKRFEVTRALQSATLRFAADFSFATVSLNQQRVLDVAPYSQTQTLDVTNSVARGENTLEIAFREAAPLVGAALSLHLTYADGSRQTIVSDGSWIVTDPQGPKPLSAFDLGAVPPELWGIGRRDLSLSAFENYEQWQQSKKEVAGKYAKRIQVPTGFEVTEVRSAGSEEGSWVAMAFDAQGRLTISREDTGFLRLTFAQGFKTIDKVEPVESILQECRGLGYDGDTLYANANNSKGLFRLKIDGTGKARDTELLREYPGQVGHGRNDLALVKGADGKLEIYSIHGDSVELPTGNVVDRTSPVRETRLLPARKEGSLVVVQPGAKVAGQPLATTILHAGLRNPYGIALDRWNVPFTFDADNEHDMGTPWYRPTRILQLVTGGDSGYREVTGLLPPRFHDQPDHAPQLFDVGRSSPTSVMFGYGLAFPAQYRRALFALDWTYGRVLAIHMAPRGQTYRVGAETFLQGRPLNVTDVATGPDGAMYLITGGRKTQSALYRVAWTGKTDPQLDAGLSPYELACQTQAQQARADRPPNDASADPVGRHAARLALESQGPVDLVPERGVAPRRRLTKLLATARGRRAEQVVPVLEAALDLLKSSPLEEHDLTSQYTWTRIVGLCRETNPSATLERSEALSRPIVAAWKASIVGPYRVSPEVTSTELHRRWAYLLGELSSDDLPAMVCHLLLDSAVQEDQLAGLFALRSQRTGWTPELRSRQFEALVGVSRMVGGAGLPATQQWLRDRTLETASEEERKEFLALYNARQEVAEPPARNRPLVQKWSLENLGAEIAAEFGTLQERKESVDRGQQVFREASCAKCHRVGLRGAAVGPDLSFVGRRFSRRDILESILSPSLSVAENFRLELIETTSGKTYSGRIVPEGDYRKEMLRLSTDPLDPSKFVDIDKKEIVDHQLQQLSPMPGGLLDTFTADEIRDLLTYLEAGD